MKERWLPVPGYEGAYEVSDQGRLRSLDRVVIYSNGKRRLFKGKLLLLNPNPRTGYCAGHLRRQSMTNNVLVHRAVMAAFVGPCPEGYEVAHNNGVRHDNRLENLRYDTRAGNHADKLAHGTWQGGEANGASKLTALQALAIKQLRNELNWSQQNIADAFGVSRRLVLKISRGDLWGRITSNLAS